MRLNFRKITCVSAVLFFALLLSVSVATASYSAPITVTNNPGQTGYQAKINLAYQTGMSADFSNVRFYNDSTELSYWLQPESVVSSTNATFWIPINSATNLTCRWGITGETVSKSNGSNVMEFFDEFSGDSVNSSMWTPSIGTGGSISVSNNELTLISSTNTNSASTIINATNAVSTLGTTIEFRSKLATGQHFNIGAKDAAFTNYAIIAAATWTTTKFYGASSTGTEVTVDDSTVDNLYHVWSIARANATTTVYKKDGVVFGTTTTQIPSSSLYPMIRSYRNTASSTVNVDYIYVRKHTTIEPTLTLGSVTQTPVADFSANPTSGTLPLTVAFTDASSNTPTSWLWDFGDGNTSTEQNPTHAYYISGSKTVSLTVSNSLGSDSETKVNLITISYDDAPTVSFSPSKISGVIPTTVTFKDTSTDSPTSWAWDFGDGTTSTEQNPEHTFNSSGDFTVVLVATNSNGYASSSVVIHVGSDAVTYPYQVNQSEAQQSLINLSESNYSDVRDPYRFTGTQNFTNVSLTNHTQTANALFSPFREIWESRFGDYIYFFMIVIIAVVVLVKQKDTNAATSVMLLMCALLYLTDMITSPAISLFQVLLGAGIGAGLYKLLIKKEG